MTYSIVARDPATGQLGVAVQSHWFSVGPIVPWAEAGVGAVATQALVDPAYGPRGLELMRAGTSAPDALAKLVAEDESADVRQVAMADAAGNVAVHTGDKCIAAAGHHIGGSFSAQANMMLRDTVWDAMASAFEESDGELTDRLLAALDAAEAEGGDIRGRQSAAILVVAGENTGKPWEDRLVDLRVEDHADPLPELRRLLALHRAYVHMDRFDQAQEAGDDVAAWVEVTEAERFAPDNQEIAFWKAQALALAGREDEARQILARLYRRNPDWAELLRRLPAAGLFDVEPDLLERLAAPPG